MSKLPVARFARNPFVELLEKQKVEITKKILEAEVILQDLQQQAMKIYQEVEAAA